MNIREYLKEKKILCDGAFGTYFSEKSRLDENCLSETDSLTAGQYSLMPEKANLTHPSLVKQIHRDYMEAGANLIRTNTFASNTAMLACTPREQQENIRAAVRLAKEAVAESGQRRGNGDGNEVFIAGDIGPVDASRFPVGGAEIVKEEYARMISTFLEEGIDILVFETFSDYEVLSEALLKALGERQQQKNDIFVILQFSVNQHGYTGAGISARRIVEELSDCELVDAVGFNCGVGPGHMCQILSGLSLPEGKFITALPNASYPTIQQDRIVFLENQEYFAQKMTEMSDIGADILGGCCGTNPSYIQRTKSAVDWVQRPRSGGNVKMRERTQIPTKNSAFYAERTCAGRTCAGKDAAVENAQAGAVSANRTGANPGARSGKLLAVEIAPPFHADDEKIMDAAHFLAAYGADAVTFPDSPSGRTRADSIMMGIKAAQSTGMCVMPHICCRDKNAIAIRAQLLGGYLNGVRNFLVVTGDPIPTMMRGNVRSVFNFDSVGLMKIIQEMNEEEFAADPVCYGGALNHNRRNLDVEIGRMRKKMEAGASFFLTQPSFTKDEAERLRQIRRAVPEARILCGVMPLISRKNAVFIRNEMVGIQVTEEIIGRYREDMNREEGEAVGVSIAKEVIEMTKEFVDGYYFSIPFNRVYLLQKIFE